MDSAQSQFRQLLGDLAGEAAQERRPSHDLDQVLALYEAAKVELLDKHQVPFTLTCAAGDAGDCCAGYGHLANLESARARGWTEIAAAPGTGPGQTIHFVGRCPECSRIAMEMA